MTARSSSQVSRGVLLFVAVLAGTVSLAGCAAAAGPENPVADVEDEATTETVEEPAPAGLEDTDFGNLSWGFRPGGSSPEVQQIDLVDGVAADGMVSYELGEVLLAELTGDDRLDAAVQITRLDGNALDEQWYLWIATDEGPVQSTLPIARMSRCGTVIHSVKAVADGIEIHETRRAPGDESIPCSDSGSDERTRTVRAVEMGSTAEWWPVQTAPIDGFGGLCPSTAFLHPWENDGPLYSVPDTSAGETIEAAHIIELEEWPVYSESVPEWVLVGVQDGDTVGCAWGEKA